MEIQYPIKKYDSKGICEVCDGIGVLIDVSINDFIGDKDNMLVQKCDSCQKYKNDFQAAQAYCKNNKSAIRGIVVRR